MLVTVEVVLFVITSVFGLIIPITILKNKLINKPFVLVHGPLAATAITNE